MRDIVYSEKQKIFLVVGCGGNRGLSIQDMRKYVNNSNKDVDLEYMITLPGNSNGKVEFGNDCSQCMGCIQWCPNNAIDYQGKAINRKKYHHLNIKKYEMFIR